MIVTIKSRQLLTHVERRRCGCLAAYQLGDPITATPATSRTAISGTVHAVEGYTVVIDTGVQLVAVDVEDCRPRLHLLPHGESLAAR
jgi:hypothetical protein